MNNTTLKLALFV